MEYKPSDPSDPRLTSKDQKLDMADKAEEALKTNPDATHHKDGPGETHQEPAHLQEDEHKPSALPQTDQHNEHVPASAPHENALCPNCPPEVEENVDESDMNPYERALRDNENHKKRFVEELKREAEERKKREKEEREAKEQAEKEKREWLEQVYKDTGEMPPELAEILAAEEAKR